MNRIDSGNAGRFSALRPGRDRRNPGPARARRAALLLALCGGAAAAWFGFGHGAGAEEPAGGPAALPPSTVPVTEPAAVATTHPATIPPVEPAAVPATAPATAPAPSTGPTTTPALPPPAVAATVPATRPVTAPAAPPSRRFGRRDEERSDRRPRGSDAPPTPAPPAPAPATAPPVPALTQSKPLPQKYAVLLRRDVFTRGRPAGYFDPAGIWHPNGPATRPDEQPGVTTRPTTRGDAPTVAEVTLVLKGIADVDGEYVAFIEDPAAGRTRVLKAGDPIARGRVRGMTLDALEYEADGKARQVEVGQNLRGETAAPGSAAGFAPTLLGAGPAPAAPPGAAPPPGAPVAGEDETVRRMRERRAREGG